MRRRKFYRDLRKCNILETVFFFNFFHLFLLMFLCLFCIATGASSVSPLCIIESSERSEDCHIILGVFFALIITDVHSYIILHL